MSNALTPAFLRFDERSPWRRLARGIVQTVVTALVTASMAGLAIHVHLQRLWSPERIGDAVADRPSPTDMQRALASLRRVESAIEAYRLVEGHYPTRLEAIVESHALDPDALRGGPPLDQYYYVPTERSYVLLPPRLSGGL